MASTRKNRKPRQVVREDVFSGEGDEGPSTARRPKSGMSRRAMAQQMEERDAGKLSKLPSMPLDILYDIFSLVHPVDLLRMSWANKAFRIVLTSESSRQVWVAAFHNIPEDQIPPPCPEDLAEIAYANLLYGPFCMGCGAPRGRTYWAARVRVCMGCIKNWVTVVGGVQDQAVVALSHDELHSSSQVLPTVSVKIQRLPKNVYIFTKDLKQLKMDLEVTRDKSAVIRRYEDALVAKGEFTETLDRLGRTGIVGRGALLMAANNSRIDQILERLEDQGWGEIIASRCGKSAIEVFRHACKARPFTKKAWEEMEVKILGSMRSCKEEIERDALRTRRISRVNKIRKTVQEYQQIHHPYDFHLAVEDICQIPAARRAIVDGTDEEFNAWAEEFASGLPKLTSRILEERTARLSALLPFSERPDDVLSLATVWFKCGSCFQYYAMHGHHALSHQCPPWGRAFGEPTDEDILDGYVLHRGSRPEVPEIKFSKSASTVARRLILDCGEDPESITLAEINSKLHRFVFDRGAKPVARGWEDAFNYEHHTGRHFIPPTHHRFLGPDECPEFVHDPDAYNEEESWGCLHCRGRIPLSWGFETLPTVKQHLSNKHGLDTPTEDVDYFFSRQHRPPKFVRINQSKTNPPPL